MHISVEDAKLLNGIWWDLERLDIGRTDGASMEEISDVLFGILERLDNQGGIYETETGD